MRITTYGVRGSLPISNPKACRYGGNTTCLRIESECIPKDRALIIDAGTGFLPASNALLTAGIFNIDMLFTHYHHDHTQGMTLAPHTFHPQGRITMWGPKEHAKGPFEIFSEIMRAPHFPVDFEKVRHKFKATGIEHVGTKVLIIHPIAGAHLLPAHIFAQCADEGKQLLLGKNKYAIDQCLVIKMYKTMHPEYTVSYRIEERPTGKVFVFLTDHENTAGIPMELRRHVHEADLLIQDAQYSSEVYEGRTAGFGHGTPGYCAEVAMNGKVKRLGITHHDPDATDEQVDLRVYETRDRAIDLGAKAPVADWIFGCACYQVIEC